MKKETLIEGASGVSGVTSIIGSAQACHNICVGGFATLSAAGTIAASLPIFLQKLSIPLWLVGIALLAVLAYLYVQDKGVNPAFLFLNGGILLAGMPFISMKSMMPFFWIAGGVLALIGVFLLVRKRFS